MILHHLALDTPLFQCFTYAHPIKLARGTRVGIPFGRGDKLVVGIVLDHPEQLTFEPSKLRDIACVFDEQAPLSEDILAMADFAANYYHHPIGESVFTALPTALRVAKVVKSKRPVPIGGDEWPAPELAQALPLNAEQQQAVTQLIAQQGFGVTLLHGITGSGKTEAYLQLLSHILEQGQQALVLIPEISLSPQLIERFTQRFPHKNIVTLHSQLSDKARFQAWAAAQAGLVDIVIGTRLAIFTPLPRLAYVIVDEEHDSSFKQMDGLRYHARDLAIWRARYRNCPVVLGSATPSLESLNNVQQGRFGVCTLPKRAHPLSNLPRVALIETRNQRLHHGLTQAALDALANNLRKTGQISMVFVNKRGYAPVLACQQCGWLSNCPNCSAKQVLHLKDRLLRCHHCGSHAPIPHACPSCGNQDIQPLGEGTQRIESALAEYFPQARILRIDRDNTQGKDNWDIIYQKIKQGEVDLIIGTQMLAKGHDFGCLSLVLIIGADGGLYASDYRASERLFGLLTQVVGRAGRAELTGQVLIQTQLSEHPLYQALIRHDFNGFAANLLAERKTNHFPPFMSHAILRANAPTLTQAESWLSACMTALEPLCQSLANQPATQAISLYGPAPAPMLKVANRERAQIVIECPSRVALQKFLQQARPFIDALSTSAVRWHIDVDPIDL